MELRNGIGMYCIVHCIGEVLFIMVGGYLFLRLQEVLYHCHFY
jgi:hypothetical protein